MFVSEKLQSHAKGLDEGESMYNVLQYATPRCVAVHMENQICCERELSSLHLKWISMSRLLTGYLLGYLLDLCMTLLLFFLRRPVTRSVPTLLFLFCSGRHGRVLVLASRRCVANLNMSRP